MADPTDSPQLTPDAQTAAADLIQKGGYSDAQVAGALGVQGAESGLNPGAINPTSKAYGLAQDMPQGRLQGLAAFSNQNHMDPTSADTQELYNLAELHGHAPPGGSDERQAGAALWNSRTPGDAVNAWMSFERPAAADVPAETAQANQYAQKLEPVVAAYRKTLNEGQPAVPEMPGVDPAEAFGKWDQQTGPVGGGKFDRSPLPPTEGSPRPASTADAFANWDQKVASQQKAAAAVGTGNDNTPTSDTFGQFWDALREAPRGVAHGITSMLGMSGDIGNLVSALYAKLPPDVVANAATGGISGLGLGNSELLNSAANNANTPAWDPNAKAIHLPIGTEDIEGAVKRATGLDLHQQAQGVLPDILYNAGTFVTMGANPLAIARDVAGGASVLSLIGRHILAPGAMGGGADLGAWAAGNTPNEKMIANLALAPAAIASRAALEGALLKTLNVGRAGAGAAKTAIDNSAWQAVDDAYQASYGEGAAAEKAKALANLDTFPKSTPLPAAYQAPAVLQTSSDPLRQFFANNVASGGALHNQFITGTAPTNTAALRGMAPEGNPADAVTAVRSQLASAQATIEQRLALADQNAQRAAQTAAINSKGQTLEPGGADGQIALANNAQSVLDEIRGARADTKAWADGQWQVARNQGLTSVTALPTDTSNLYSSIISRAEQHLQGGGDERDFPFADLNPLFKAPLRGMLGRDRAVPLDQLPTGQDGGPNAFYSQPTIDQLKNVDSSLGERIRQEQDAISTGGNRGNRILLRNLQDVRSSLWNTIDQTAIASGNISSLRNAMNATALYHNTFSHGLIGDLLSTSPEDAGLSGNPQNVLRRFLANSGSATQGAQMFMQAAKQRTGAAAAEAQDALGQPGVADPQEQFHNVVSDWLRQDYLNTRADSGLPAARRWLTNRAGFFGKLSGIPQYDQLHGDLLHYQQAADIELPAVQSATKRSLDDIQGSAANEFLGGEGGPRLDAILRSDRPLTEMRGVVQAAQGAGDGGQAFRGLQKMMINKLLLSATVHDPVTGGQYMSGAAARAFLEQNKPAYAAIGEKDPGWLPRLQTTMNGLSLEDAARRPPRLDLPASTGPGASTASDLTTSAMQVAAVSATHHLGIGKGTIQIPGIVSQQTRKLFPGIQRSLAAKMGRIDVFSAAQQALRDAVMDPDKLRPLLTPLNTPLGQSQLHGIEPWLQATGLGEFHSILTGAHQALQGADQQDQPPPQ